MNELLAPFHFLRPFWLFAAIPAFLIAVWLLKRKGSAASWRAAIAPDLIDYLLESTQQARPRWPWLLLAGWLLAVFALAGPTWEKLPQPVLQKRDGLVIVLDLSLSMYAEDIKPSRLQRARFKVIDILKQRREGLTGLVVYSGDAHVVSPLTDDTATIENLVPALAPAIMPNFGSNAAAGIDTALELLRNSGFERGRILLLSDEISEADVDKIAAQIDGEKWQLAIVGIGTAQGAPIPLPGADRAGEKNRNRADSPDSGSFLKQENGTIAIARLHRERLTDLAAKTGGRYADIQVDDSDIAQAISGTALTDDSVRTLEREFDQWHERGPQFVLLLLPLAAFVFRRGWLLVLFLIPFSPPSEAWEWRDLWQRPDQQAQRDFDAGNSKAAAEKFEDANWRAAAQYRAGDFAGAAETLQSIDSVDAHYNRGNALAHEGKLKEAIATYDEALKKNPAMEDARANRDLVERILKQQQQQKNQQPDRQNDSSQEQKPSDDSSRSSTQQNASSDNSSPQNTTRQNPSSPEQQNAAQSQPDENHSSPPDNAHGGASAAENQPGADGKAGEQKSASKSDEQNRDTDTRAQAMNEKGEADQSQTMSNASAENELTPEQQRQQRATEQWLQQVPDDPSGLLRRKFMYESQQRERQATNTGKPLW